MEQAWALGPVWAPAQVSETGSASAQEMAETDSAKAKKLASGSG
jgi:hypothetical protein